MASHAPCTCARRPQAHWAFHSLEDWTLFLGEHCVVDRRVLTQGESGKVNWDSIRVLLFALEECWHAGSVADDPAAMLELVDARASTPTADFAFSWTRAKSALEEHPERVGELWHPFLEAVRARECEGERLG